MISTKGYVVGVFVVAKVVAVVACGLLVVVVAVDV
jgi:hypothetical protein